MAFVTFLSYNSIKKNMEKLCLNSLQNILPLYETFVQNIINITHRIAEKNYTILPGAWPAGVALSK